MSYPKGSLRGKTSDILVIDQILYMASNIVEAVQKNLGLPPLQKVDPNTQEVRKPEKSMGDAFFYQAAVPAVLIGLYKFTRIKEGNTALLYAQTPGGLLQQILGDLTTLVVEKVSNYTGAIPSFTAENMERIAVEAVNVLKTHLPKANDEEVKSYFAGQRSNILKFLPAGLQIGEILHDDAIDDRTNKMEGPISGHLHWIEKQFSGTDRKKEENF